jgi:hypothetical protein
MSAYASIDDLRSQLGKQSPSPSSMSYTEKMLHKIPVAEVIDREAFILEHCTGKRVLEFGASGPMHDGILKVAADVLGVDREHRKQGNDIVIGFDLDDVTQAYLPGTHFTPEVIVCGEVLEHLSNPGWFLTRLRRQFGDTPTIITVPNAFSAAAQKQLLKGIENVNADHVAWYSFRTLKTLLGRAGYTDFSFAWYRGHPLIAEGIVVLCGTR